MSNTINVSARSGALNRQGNKRIRAFVEKERKKFMQVPSNVQQNPTGYVTEDFQVGNACEDVEELYDGDDYRLREEEDQLYDAYLEEDAKDDGEDRISEDHNTSNSNYWDTEDEDAETIDSLLSESEYEIEDDDDENHEDEIELVGNETNNFDSDEEDTVNVAERKEYENFLLKGNTRKNIDALDFDIIHEAKTLLNKQKFSYEEDEFKPFSKDGSVETTVGGFARDAHEFLTVNRLSQKAQIDFLRLWDKYVGKTHNVPLQKSKKNGKTYYRSLLKDFIKESKRSVELDVCSNYCCVYAGQLADQRQCHICGKDRYYKCTRNNCAKSMSEIDDCHHSMEYRIPLKTINYQSIIMLFCSLAENEYFVKATKYNHVKDHSYKFSDVSDGSCFQKNMHEMNVRHLTVVKAKQTYTSIEALNVCIAINYDGVQIYRHLCSTFNPLMMTVLNLPPSFRSKVGVGMFLLSLFTLKEKTEAEYFIFHKCLLPELQALERGYLHKFGNRLILIQVRLISLLLDTPMVTKQLMVEGHTSYASCPICGVINGVSGNGGTSGGGSKRVGHRCFLPLNHFLRSWGQSENCCPPGFYKDYKIEVPLVPTHSCTVPLNLSRSVCNICDAANLENVKDFLSNTEEPFVWFHDDTPFHGNYNGLRNYLYYVHADYRPLAKYQRVVHNIVTARNSDNKKQTNSKGTSTNYKPWFLYLNYFNVGESLTWCVFHAKMGVGRHTLREITNEAITDRKGKFKEHLKQTLSHPYLFDVDESTNYSNESLIADDSNKKLNKRPTLPIERYEKLVADKNAALAKEYGRGQGTQFFLPNDYLYRIPWKAQPKELQDIGAYINALHVPSGLTDKFQLYDIFPRQGQLRGAEVITILEDCLDYMLIACNIDDAYKQYYSMLSSDIREMGKPCVRSSGEIYKIFDRISETISVHEGIFPIFLSDFVFHELVDIVHHIEYQGPQKAFSTISGERANSVLKRFVRNGGRNSMKTVLNSYLHSEAYTTSKTYSCELENKDTDLELCKILNEDLWFNSEFGSSVSSYAFNIFHFKMNAKQVDCSNEELTEFEMINLVSTLLLEVEKQSSCKQDAIDRSSLYAIYDDWVNQRKFHSSNSSFALHEKFYYWIKRHFDSASTTTTLNSKVISEVFNLKQIVTTKFYKYCRIYGTKFASRGMKYRIREYQDFEVDGNSVRYSWWNKNQYSSWCQYRLKQNNDCSFGNTHGSRAVAQINFRIDIPSDTLLNGVPLASISHRKTKDYHRLHRYDVGKISRRPVIFIAATNIVPCRQLLAGFDQFNKPYRFRGKQSTSFSSLSRNSINYVLCIQLDRKNECLEYSNEHNVYYNLSAEDKD